MIENCDTNRNMVETLMAHTEEACHNDKGDEFQLPEWIRNPFACRYSQSSDSEGEEQEEAAEVHQDTPETIH